MIDIHGWNHGSKLVGDEKKWRLNMKVGDNKMEVRDEKMEVGDDKIEVRDLKKWRLESGD